MREPSLSPLWLVVLMLMRVIVLSFLALVVGEAQNDGFVASLPATLVHWLWRICLHSFW